MDTSEIIDSTAELTSLLAALTVAMIYGPPSTSEDTQEAFINAAIHVQTMLDVYGREFVCGVFAALNSNVHSFTEIEGFASNVALDRSIPFSAALVDVYSNGAQTQHS